MLELAIDLEMLQMVFDQASGEQISYLDKETGEVILQVDGFSLEAIPNEASASVEEWEAFQKRYIPIPPAPSREGYQDMTAFIATVTDPDLKSKLELAIDGPGAFRRFKQVMGGESERERWLAFREERARARLLKWLESVKIQPILEQETEGVIKESC